VRSRLMLWRLHGLTSSMPCQRIKGVKLGAICTSAKRLPKIDRDQGRVSAIVARSPAMSSCPTGVPRGATMRAQWTIWKKLSPVFDSKDLIWTDALSRVHKLWSRC
jgi:hypothetical protein